MGHRAGIDLNPLDVTAPHDLRWLEALIWPGMEHRIPRISAGAALVAQAPPSLFAGDLNDRLVEVLDQVPAAMTPVVFHTAVLAYLPDDARLALADTLRELPGHWVSQEGVNVLPDLHRGAAEAAAEMTEPFFVQSVDGEPTALVGPHGAWIQPL